MKCTFLLLLTVSIISYSAEVIVGDPEVSGCAPIGIG
jgi:hypothetical protein